MPMIRECIVTTVNARGAVHIAPLGIIADTPGVDDGPQAEPGWIIAPFRPSTTLENLTAVPFAVANYVDDVRIFAGCLTGRSQWPTLTAGDVPVPRLAAALAHAELEVERVTEDAQRPRFHCRVVRRASHAPFEGLNRAKAAVIEAAILVSRLGMLPRERVEREIAYLEISIGKTAGADEQEAWGWLMEKVARHYAETT
jgi:hypothetical protein